MTTDAKLAADIEAARTKLAEAERAAAHHGARVAQLEVEVEEGRRRRAELVDAVAAGAELDAAAIAAADGAIGAAEGLAQVARDATPAVRARADAAADALAALEQRERVQRAAAARARHTAAVSAATLAAREREASFRELQSAEFAVANPPRPVAA